MAKEDLPKGSLQPRAQPVSAFIEQSAITPARPAEPSLVRAPGQFSLIQTPGRPNIAGPSPEEAGRAAGSNAEQLANALGRFNTELTRTAGNVLAFYAQDQNERGFNEVMRASTLLDRQQRQSAQEYGAENRALAQRDPLAAMAMDQVNPFRMGGRKRALATLAGQEIPGALELAVSDPKLLLEQPGSPVLTKVRSDAVAGVLTKYGVDEGSPGFNDFVLPQLNRAWERAVAQHQDKRVKYLDSTIGRTGAIEVQNQLSDLLVNKNLPPDQAAAMVQQSLDEILGAIGLPEKVADYQEQIIRRAWEMARTDGNLPMMAALGQLLTGLPGEEGRIPVALAYGLELGEINDKVDGREYTQRNRARSEDERTIRQSYLDLVAEGVPPEQAVQMLTNDPERFTNLTQAERLQALEGIVTAQSSIEEKLFDDAQFFEFTNQFRDAAANGQWSDEQRQEFLAQAEQWIQSAPPGLRDRLRGEVRQVRDGNDGAKARGIGGRANQLIGERIEANLTREYPEFSQSNAGYNTRAWMTRKQDMAESRSRQRAAFTTHVNAYLAQQEQKLGRRLTEPEIIQFTTEALDGYGKRDPKQLMNLFPGGAGSGAPSSVQGGVVPAQPSSGPTPGAGGGRGGAGKPAQPLPTTYTTSTLENAPNLRDWNSQPLLDPQSALDLIPRVLNGGAFPPSLVRAAKKAGTSPGRLLIRQLDFMRDEKGQPQFELTPDQRQRILRQGQQRAAVENYSESMVATQPTDPKTTQPGIGGESYTPTSWARSWMRRLIEPGYVPMNPANPGDWRWRLRGPDGNPQPVGPGGSGYYEIGSIGPTSTGRHAHIDRFGPGGNYVNFSRGELDRFVQVDGKPISRLVTLKGGEQGAGRDYGPHTGWDYAPNHNEKGRLTLTGGAQWVSHRKTEHGEESIFRTPDGTRYRIIHGTFRRKAGGVATQGRSAPSVGPFASTNPTNMQSGMKALLRAGFPRRGAAYLAGNIQQESGWNGRREWKDPGDGARAGGLVSWNDSAGANRRLSRIEARLGKPITRASHAEQLAAMVAEMRQSHPRAYRIFMDPNATDAQLVEASRMFWGYGHEGRRYEYARQLAGG